MVGKKPKANEVQDLEYLAERGWGISDLNTEDIAKIMQISQNKVTKLCKSGWLESQKIPDSKDRMIQVDALINTLRDKWKKGGKEYFNYQYPQRQLHHFMEIGGLNPEDYGLEGLAGEGGLRFHRQERIYTTGEVVDLIKVSHQTIIRCVNRGIFKGYRIPDSDYIRIPVGEIARCVCDEKMPLMAGVEIEPSPEIVTYPDLCVGYEKDKGWKDGTKVAESMGGQLMWYRCSNEVHEASIRQDEDYGLYIKLIGIDEDEPRIDLILLGRANLNVEGGILPKKEHLKRVKELIELGESLLEGCSHGNFAPIIGEEAQEAIDVVSKAQERLENVYFQN